MTIPGQMIVQSCLQADIDQAYANLNELLREGYSPVDVITTLFRVIKTYPMPEHAKLEFIKVRRCRCPIRGRPEAAF